MGGVMAAVGRAEDGLEPAADVPEGTATLVAVGGARETGAVELPPPPGVMETQRGWPTSVFFFVREQIPKRWLGLFLLLFTHKMPIRTHEALTLPRLAQSGLSLSFHLRSCSKVQPLAAALMGWEGGDRERMERLESIKPISFFGFAWKFQAQKPLLPTYKSTQPTSVATEYVSTFGFAM